MMMIVLRRFGLTAAVLGVLSVFGAGAARADFIVNGSFENPGTSNYAIYTNGSVPGWTSNNNEIEIDRGAVLPAYDGVQSVELNGNTFDTISQTVTGLTVGQNYILTWAYAGRGGSGPQQMNVLFNGTQVGQNTNDGNSNFTWTNNSVVVKATSTTATVSFAAINVGGSSALGNELDAVTLNAVAEPASAALLGVGMLGLAVWRRRRGVVAAG